MPFPLRLKNSRPLSLGRRANLIGSLLGFVCLTSSSEAWAHVGEIHSEANSWGQWAFTPDVVIATVLVGVVYAAGVIRRHAFDDMELWRHAAFAAGVAAVFLALESPIDYAAEHAFFMHQVQIFFFTCLLRC